jgi:hypothetical protein
MITIQITYNNYVKGAGIGLGTLIVVFWVVFGVLDMPFLNFFLLPGKAFILAIFLLGVAVVSGPSAAPCSLECNHAQSIQTDLCGL